MCSTIRITSVLAVVLAAGVSMPTIANAADLLVDPPVIEAPEVVTKVASGWYIRGDISYDFHSTDNPSYAAGGTSVDFTSADVDDSYNVGFGVGYQVNDYFRADLTGEYVFDASFRGSTAGFCDSAALAAGELNCTSVDDSSYTAFKLMANGYVDLGKFNGITPYVGAGLGGAYITWDSLTNTATCTQITVVCPNDGGAYTGDSPGYTGTAATSTRTDVHGGTSSWRFAWALHAGFSYDISHAAKLDFGYTYSRIESGEMFEFLDGSGTQGHDDGFEDHILRVGLRYQIW